MRTLSSVIPGVPGVRGHKGRGEDALDVLCSPEPLGRIPRCTT